ncbi:MAG: hypothetical protein ACPGR0_03975 [Candidatus Poseidoniaceae archaeon]
MRGRLLLTMMVAAMMLVPVQAGDVTVQQSEQQEDTRQPSANATTLYLWHDGINNAWTHFDANDTTSAEDGVYNEEINNGLIDIDLRFRMNPELDKRLLMTVDGELRGTLKVDLHGDWTNGDNQGPCQNDCEQLNITVNYGMNELYRYQHTSTTTGEQEIPFTYRFTEEDNLWDGRDGNPVIHITMKLRGNQQNGIFPGTTNGEPASFTLFLGEDSRVDLPIHESTWEEAFQAGEDGMDEEESPGFGLVVASAAIAMAAVAQRGRIEDE